MKNSVLLFKKVIKTLLISLIFLISCFNTLAVTGEAGGGEDIKTGEWEIIWEESADGSNVSSKKMELNDTLIIKTVAKARQTNTYYRTVGWAVSTKRTTEPTDFPKDTYIIGTRYAHMEESWSPQGSPLMEGSEFVTKSSEEVSGGFNYADFRIDKKDIFSAFMKKWN